MGTDNDAIMALDIGSVRIGVAIASKIARLPHPIGIVKHDADVFVRLREMCKREGVAHIVIGLPRGLSGQDTQQTQQVRAFGIQLGEELRIPYTWQDEALTSVQAEAELEARRKPYAKQDIDALAAAYILGDYLHAPV